MLEEEKLENDNDGLAWLIIIFILWLLFKSPYDLFADKNREILHEKKRTREGLLREKELIRNPTANYILIQK